MVSGKRYERIVCMITQRYGVLSGWIRNQFVVIFLLDLKVIWNYHWNADRVIIFHTVAFQRVGGVSISRDTLDRIDSCIDLCNKGAYDELVHDSHRATEEALGYKHKAQTQEKRHINFSSLVLHGKFREAVFYLPAGEGGGVVVTRRTVY